MLLTATLTTVLVACIAATPAPAQDGEPLRRRVAGVVRDEAGKPWAGARVVLYARARPAISWVDDTDLVRATTDERGRFRARILACRRYSVWAHSTPEDGAFRLTRVVEDVIAGAPVRLAALPGKREQRRVAIQGTDAWKHRAPLRVRLWSHHPQNVFLQDVALDEKGAATLPPLPGDGCFLEVFGSKGEPIWSVFVPLTTPRLQRHLDWLMTKRPVRVEECALVSGTLELRLPEPSQVKITVKHGKEPVPGAKLFRGMALTRTPFDPLHAVTDKAGEAWVELPFTGDAAAFNLLALAPGYTPCMLIKDFAVLADKGKNKPIPLTVNKGHTARGRLFYGAGKPAGGVTLLKYSAVPTGNSYNNWTGPLRYRTDAEGRFELPGCTSKHAFRLEAVLTPEQLARTRLRDLCSERVVLALDCVGSAEDWGDIRIDGLARLDLSVTGHSLDRVHILAAGQHTRGAVPQYAARLVTDRRGRASMLVPPGSAWAFLAGARGVAGSGDATAGGAGADPVAVSLDLARVHVVAGRVVDDTGKPIAGARVELKNQRIKSRSKSPSRALSNASMMRNASRRHYFFDGDRFFGDDVDYYRRCRLWEAFAPPGDHVRTDAEGRFSLSVLPGVTSCQLVASVTSPKLRHSRDVPVQAASAPQTKIELVVPRR